MYTYHCQEGNGEGRREYRKGKQEDNVRAGPDAEVAPQREDAARPPAAEPRNLQEVQTMKGKWNLREIMLKAWRIFRKGGVSFSEALHRAWNSAKSAGTNARATRS